MKSIKVFILAAALFFGILLIYPAGPSRGLGNDLQVSYIDVGQGDSALVQASNQENILIDGGPVSAGPTVVAYLKSRHVNQIDVLVASHNDADHVGGLAAVLGSGIPVIAVVYNGEPVTTTTYLNFQDAMAAQGLTPTPAAVGQAFTWGPLSVGVLNPQAPLSGEQNEDSVVLLLTYDQVRFLFPGDIGSATEGTLLAEGTPLAANILKVAHHGSKYSSSAAFLEAVKAQYAVISVGVNSYGHPAPETIDRLQAAGAQVLRTDLQGTLLFVSDGQSVYTETVDLTLYLPIVLNPPAPPVIETASPTVTSTPSTTPPPIGDNLICKTSGAAQICAWVSNGSPSQNSTETVVGTFRINSAWQTGQTMTTAWHYKSTTASCSGVTDADGIATCSRSIGAATKGYRVNVDVTIAGMTVTTWFTPK